VTPQEVKAEAVETGSFPGLKGTFRDLKGEEKSPGGQGSNRDRIMAMRGVGFPIHPHSL
jgi:hypothetical protein